MTYTEPDMADLRATMASARPRYHWMTDPHDDNDLPEAPAIRVIDYMGDYDDYDRPLLVGPFADVTTRDAELVRLRAIPLGDEVYRGGYEFVSSTIAAARGHWDSAVVAPEQIGRPETVAEFFKAYHNDPSY